MSMVRSAGAREVHMRISCPPTTHPCFYGIDTPTRSELIASSHTPDEIARAGLRLRGEIVELGAEGEEVRVLVRGEEQDQAVVLAGAAPAAR